jgi:cobaltochelatase CobS
MTNSATLPAWQTYTVGSTVEVNGVSWTITSVATRRTENGRKGRVFTLVSPDGDTVTKSSRGITLWAKSGGSPAEDDTVVEEVVRERSSAESTLGQVLADVIEPYLDSRGLTAGVDRDEVLRLVDERLAEVATRRVEVTVDGREPVDVGVQHTRFDSLLSIVACRLNAWLVGPAGSGKTTAVEKVAQALQLPYYHIGVGKQTTQAQLIGYKNVATGEYVSTQLRQAYEFGGVFCLDEVDGGSPEVLIVINALLANGKCGFPDCVVEKHPDFVLVAAANTTGQGANRQYVGRCQIDAATLDRFVFLPLDYDVTLEAAKLGVPVSLFDGLDRVEPQVFCDLSDPAAVETRRQNYIRSVNRVRVAINRLGAGVRHLVGPRANFYGSDLILKGWSVEDTLEACVWKSLDADTRAKIEANV